MNDNEPAAEDKMTRGVTIILFLFGAGAVVALALLFLILKWIWS